MKVVFLHPPLYPVNYHFYNLLGDYVDLTVYQFGNAPSDHPHWTSEKLSSLKKTFDIKVFGEGTDSFANQLNFKFLKELKKDSPEIVLSIAFWLPSLYAMILKKFFGFKFVILTDAIEETENRHSFLRHKIRKFLSTRTDRFISASELTTNYLKNNFSINYIDLSIQTIDVTQWQNDMKTLSNKELIRNKLELDEDKKLLLGVGNFTDKKNWLSAIRAVEKIKNSILILIGSGIEKENYLSYINDHHLESSIIIMDRKEGAELKEYFVVADMFIFPSKYDQFGFVVIEALASGLPVLCSKYSGASSLITDGYNGYIIDPKQDFSQDIQNTIDNLDNLKRNAYKSIDNLTLENRAKEFYTIFQKVLS